jgi:hypothetical protein
MAKADVCTAQLARLFLARLERLCNLEERLVAPPDTLGDPRRLVCKAIFATYCDCVSLGQKEAADTLVGVARSQREPPGAARSPSVSGC